jgi:EmrB/QacA subfamily drug resistance transporter
VLHPAPAPLRRVAYLDLVYAGRSPCDEGVILRTEAAAARPVAGAWVLAAAILGSSMAFIDGTVVNVALPRLQTELGANMITVQWVVEAYALFLAALLLVGGALGDAFGRRRMFALGVAIFAVASIGCGLARNVYELITARALQGIGGALLTPGSLALIGALFPENERGRAIGTWSGATGVAAAIGPLLGGWFIDSFSWRGAFFINVPLAAATLILLYARVPETCAPPPRPPIDWPGAALVTLGLGGLIYGLIDSSLRGFGNPTVLAALIGGAFTLIAFVVVEAKSATPMVPLGLFRSRPFLATNLVTLLLYAGLGGALFFLPLTLIQLYGYPARAAGAALLPFVVLVFLLSRWSGGLVDRYGSRLPLVVGPSLAALGFALLALPSSAGSYWRDFFPGISTLGLGMAITIAPLTTTVLNAVERRHAGLASGINNAIARLAGLLAVASLSIAFYRTFSHHLRGRLAILSLPASLMAAVEAQSLRLTDLRLPPNTDPHWRREVERAVADAYLAGFHRVVILAALLAVAGALVAAVLLPRRATA